MIATIAIFGLCWIYFGSWSWFMLYWFLLASQKTCKLEFALCLASPSVIIFWQENMSVLLVQDWMVQKCLHVALQLTLSLQLYASQPKIWFEFKYIWENVDSYRLVYGWENILEETQKSISFVILLASKVSMHIYFLFVLNCKH